MGSRRTVLITGASAGIGAEFARVFAERDFDLVLTARRVEPLHALARELGKGETRVEVLAADLAEEKAPERLHDATERLGLRIDALVNNAGYGWPKPFLESTWEEHLRFNQVLTSAPLKLTHLFAPAMVERGYGRIINVASLAGLVPGAPGNTLYGPAKAYLIKFSEALALELKSTGVHVLALCPGFTYTEFHDVSGTRERVGRLPGYLWMNARQVAEEGFDAVMRDDVVYVNGLVNQALASVARLLPPTVARRIMGRKSQQAE